jgi:hypothetical protein
MKIELSNNDLKHKISYPMEVSFLFWLITGEKFGNLKSCLATYDRGGE